eukprot:NODE_2726_length_1052_cov_42.053838_g2274_i0.p3 GENE.NODE_2726_length_1052_cov_42.053838_g2274_i0~~NODE_2726_length_1052_cov_42.053838_g2274_i0.p3  ORF type:complete len:55 (+),score=15.23 NODE_2726_length_1052_cov_42.053838_g2274_i0:303-467(+)
MGSGHQLNGRHLKKGNRRNYAQCARHVNSIGRTPHGKKEMCNPKTNPVGKATSY